MSASASRKALRKNQKNLLKKNQKLVKEYSEVRVEGEIADYIVNKKTKEALKEITMQQTAIELRAKAGTDVLWMMALNEMFRYKGVLQKIYDRVNELTEEQTNSHRGPNHVKDLVEVAEAEFGVKIKIPKNRWDVTPLLLGGKVISYGKMFGTVEILGEEVKIREVEAAG